MHHKHFLILLMTIILTKSEKIIPLNNKWAIYDIENTTFLYGDIPASIYHNLFISHIILDPLSGYNDLALRYLSKKEWIFSLNTRVLQSDVQGNNIALYFEGIDSIASIYINNQDVGSSSNMFKPKFFPLKDHIDFLQGDQDIVINIKLHFKSPINYSRELSNTTYANRSIPPICPPNGQHGECHINLIRKEQCSFSWDWGPAIPDIGLWKPVKLIIYKAAYLEHVNIFTDLSEKKDEWTLKVVASFKADSNLMNQSIGDLLIQIPELSVESSFDCILNQDFTCQAVFTIPCEKVDLWWPSGHGNQTLYLLQLKFTAAKTHLMDEQKDMQERSLQIGFRTVKVVEENCPGQKEERFGKSFYFLINGRQIYAKGSNWIPADLIKPSITESYTERLLLSAKEANMNMLRVWGGGVYESDHFYSEADRLGIMIWQDAMFACALYPADQTFIESVREEIEHQVKRLQHHPSVVLWSANNENELALSQGWYNSGQDQKLYEADYYKLYVSTVYKTARELLGPKFPIFLSSPSNGNLGIAKNQTIDSNPQNQLYGDVHFYDYFSDLWDWSIYPKARFVSEYGYQAWPSYRSLLTVVGDEEKDLIFGSKFTNHRQHHSLGNFEIFSQILLHFTKPSDTNKTLYFQKFTYLSQISQAIAIKTQTEFYRRNRMIDAQGEGFNMGALYWQLNDVWLAPTWSSLVNDRYKRCTYNLWKPHNVGHGRDVASIGIRKEYKGLWKMLHYEARKFFAPVLITLHLENQSLLSVNVVCDIPLHEDLHTNLSSKPYNFIMELRSTLRFGLLQPSIILTSYELPPMNVTILGVIDLKSWPAFDITDPHQYIRVYSDHPSKYIVGNRAFMGYPKNWRLVNPQLKYEVTKIENATFEIVLTAEAPAIYVWLDLKENRYLGRFSDNGFIMDEPLLTIHYIPWDLSNISNISASWFYNNLDITTLYDL